MKQIFTHERVFPDFAGTMQPNPPEYSRHIRNILAHHIYVKHLLLFLI
jgi:hypothetical protein